MQETVCDVALDAATYYYRNDAAKILPIGLCCVEFYATAVLQHIICKRRCDTIVPIESVLTLRCATAKAAAHIQ